MKTPIAPSKLRFVVTNPGDGIMIDVYQTGYADPRPMRDKLSKKRAIALARQLLEAVEEADRMKAIK